MPAPMWEPQQKWIRELTQPARNSSAERHSDVLFIKASIVTYNNSIANEAIIKRITPTFKLTESYIALRPTIDGISRYC